MRVSFLAFARNCVVINTEFSSTSRSRANARVVKGSPTWNGIAAVGTETASSSCRNPSRTVARSNETAESEIGRRADTWRSLPQDR